MLAPWLFRNCSSFEKCLHWLEAQKSQNYDIIYYLDDFDLL